MARDEWVGSLKKRLKVGGEGGQRDRERQEGGGQVTVSSIPS